MINNFNSIERNSINDSNILVQRSKGKHAGVILRKIATAVIIVSLLSTTVYLSNKKDNNVSYGYTINSTEYNDMPNPTVDFDEKVNAIEEDQQVLTDEEKVAEMFKKMYKHATENEIKDLSSYYDEHYFDINYDVNNNEPNKELMYLYASNAYKKAHDMGISDDIITKELAVMYSLQELPGCLSEENIKKMSNLDSTLNPQSESLFMIYGPLSVLTHNETCTKNHVVNAAGGISHEGEEPDFEIHYTLTKTLTK